MSTTSTATERSTLEVLVGSEARAAILSWFFLHPNQEALLRELARSCGLSVTPVHRQLQKLEEIRLVESRMIGNSKAYRLREGFPGLQGLAEFVRSTAGLAPLLQEALAGLEIDVAFIFGSVAEGTDGDGSDVDLFVIGEVAEQDLHARLWPLERRLLREINYVLYPPGDLASQMQSPSAFLMNVMRLEKIFLKGDESALRDLVARRRHQATVQRSGPVVRRPKHQ
jgi:predicted nucleotidyltransferase